MINCCIEMKQSCECACLFVCGVKICPSSEAGEGKRSKRFFVVCSRERDLFCFLEFWKDERRFCLFCAFKYCICMRQSEKSLPFGFVLVVELISATYVGLPIVLRNWSTSRPLDGLLGLSLQVHQPPPLLGILASRGPGRQCLRHSERVEVDPSVDRGCVD